ncbi:MAG TPA: hypothetical protein DEV72_04315 [Ktedonobacter sp.]|jgi:hypothetical protein|nr:hypothetical protein [Ktedonobacter sp.]HCF84408.1 hypothetical protein [Ktedonobacter sp.]
MGYLLNNLYKAYLCLSISNLRTRTPTLNVQSNAINTAIPANNTWFASLEKTKKEKAMPQQPSATIAGQMRLSGPRTLGDKNGRLEELTPLVVAGLTLPPLLFTIVGTLCVLLPNDPFLRFLVLDIA